MKKMFAPLMAAAVVAVTFATAEDAHAAPADVCAGKAGAIILNGFKGRVTVGECDSDVPFPLIEGFFFPNYEVDNGSSQGIFSFGVTTPFNLDPFIMLRENWNARFVSVEEWDTGIVDLGDGEFIDTGVMGVFEDRYGPTDPEGEAPVAGVHFYYDESIVQTDLEDFFEVSAVDEGNPIGPDTFVDDEFLFTVLPASEFAAFTQSGGLIDQSFFIPEPASLAVLGVGLAGLGAIRRRRRS